MLLAYRAAVPTAAGVSLDGRFRGYLHGVQQLEARTEAASPQQALNPEVLIYNGKKQLDNYAKIFQEWRQP